MKKDTEENQINNLLLRETLKGNPFLVPEDYFHTLKEEILVRKRISELGASSFSIPKNYQETLRQDILSSISEVKLEGLISDQQFSTPTGYFDDLQKRILSKTSGAVDPSINKELGKPLADKTSTKRLLIRKWIPYAAAAMLAITVGLFAIVENKDFSFGQSASAANEISSVPTDEIINYLAYYTEIGDLQYLSDQLSEPSDSFLEDFSSQEIEAYLEYVL